MQLDDDGNDVLVKARQMEGTGPRFFDLPREIRDLVYAELLTLENPRPTLGYTHWLFRFRRVWEQPATKWGEYGCAYSLEKMPSTCANFVCCNRQVYAEMDDAIRRAQKKELVAAKLDCIAEDESFHYFTWLKAPVVKTSVGVEAEGKYWLMPRWVDRLMERYWACPRRVLGHTGLACRTRSTVIPQLWVDVRLFGNRAGKWERNTSPPDRTSWAICAALRHIIDKGPDFSRVKNSAHTITIDEVVLNVVSPPDYPKEKYLPEGFPVGDMRDGLVHPLTVARELVDVWNKIWSGDEFKSSFYRVLLERIQRLRVCIDGEAWRVRELRLELERGQAERRRIAARVGW